MTHLTRMLYENSTGVCIQADGKQNTNMSHWDTASVSHDISYDNIV